MHILLTDILTCPRCGPGFGLILLADRVEERRVLEGVLGCANCREKYPVRDGAGHFGGVPGSTGAVGSAEGAVRLAGLMGLRPNSQWALVAGPAARDAAALAEMLPGLEVVAVDRDGSGITGGDGERVNRLGVTDRLPLASGRMAGVALGGDLVEALLPEAARVVSPMGRVVLQPAPGDVEAWLPGIGLRLLVHEGDTAVASRA